MTTCVKQKLLVVVCAREDVHGEKIEHWVEVPWDKLGVEACLNRLWTVPYSLT